MSRFSKCFLSGTIEPAGYTVNQEEKHAWISFSLLSAKHGLENAKRKIANLILESSGKDTIFLCDTEREIWNLEADIHRWENVLKLAVKEHSCAGYKLKPLDSELQITKESEKTALEARISEFEEFEMLKAYVNSALEQIGKTMKHNLKDREQERRKILEAYRDENESYKAKFEDLETKYKLITDSIRAIVKEKSKLVYELEVSVKEKESYKAKFEGLETKCKLITDAIRAIVKEKSKLVYELEVSEKEKERYKAQIEDLKAMNDNFENIIEEKSKLVEGFKDFEAKYEEINEDFEVSVGCIWDLETKYMQINEELEISIEEKKKLADELEASRKENETYKVQLKYLEAKYEEANDDFEIIIEEKSKLVDELEASRDESEKRMEATRNLAMWTRGLENALSIIRAENERYRIVNHELETSMNECNKAMEYLNVNVQELSSEAIEMKEALFVSQLENKNYEREIDWLKVIMEEEKTKFVNELESYKKQIEDLKAKNEKNEGTLDDWFLGDWKLVGVEEDQID